MSSTLAHVTHGSESRTRAALAFLVARTALREGRMSGGGSSPSHNARRSRTAASWAFVRAPPWVRGGTAPHDRRNSWNSGSMNASNTSSEKRGSRTLRMTSVHVMTSAAFRTFQHAPGTGPAFRRPPKA